MKEARRKRAAGLARLLCRVLLHCGHARWKLRVLQWRGKFPCVLRKFCGAKKEVKAKLFQKDLFQFVQLFVDYAPDGTKILVIETSQVDHLARNAYGDKVQLKYILHREQK